MLDAVKLWVRSNHPLKDGLWKCSTGHLVIFTILESDYSIKRGYAYIKIQLTWVGQLPPSSALNLVAIKSLYFESVMPKSKVKIYIRDNLYMRDYTNTGYYIILNGDTCEH